MGYALHSGMNAINFKQRHLPWWRLITPLLLMLFAACSYLLAAFAPSLPVITVSDMRHVDVSYDPTGALQENDLILAANQLSPDTWADTGLNRVAEVDSIYRVTINRDNRILTVTTRSQIFPFHQMALRWTGPLLVLLGCLFVVTILSLLRKLTPAEQGVRVAFIGLSISLILIPLRNTPPLNWIAEPIIGPIMMISTGMLSGAFVFFLGYSHRARIWHPFWLPVGIYAIGFLICVAALLLVPGTGLQRATFITGKLVPSIAIIIASITTFLSIYSYRKTRNPAARAQLRWIAWGLLIGVPPWLALFAIPTLFEMGNPLAYAISMVPMTAVPVSFSLAILRFRLLDVDEILNRSIAYSLMLVGLGTIYTITIATLSRVLVPIAGIQLNSVTNFIATVLIAGCFNPMLRIARLVVNRYLYRSRYNLLQLIRAAGRNLRGIEGWNALLPLLGEELPKQLNIEQAMLLLLEDGKYVGYARDGQQVTIELPPNWPLERALILQNWRDNNSPAWAQPLLDYGFQLAFILVAGGRSVGMYALGQLKSGGWYDRQAIAALDELSDRIAGAVENARLLEQNSAQASLRYELAVARRIQESLLPATTLSHGQLDIAAINLSASDVGGDLYAMQRRDPCSISLAVGDVSGKGVPAALMMAVTSAVLNTVSAQEEAPDVVLERVNQQLRSYTAQNRQNVALCYLLFKAKGCTPADNSYFQLQAANAGAIPPLLRRADGTTEWLEIGGLPLGSPLPSNAYPVSCHTLGPGDMLLLCTDGLLEAHSPQGELLSFDGVAELFAKAPCDQDAQAAIDAMLKGLNAFTEGIEVDDDVTIVIVRVRC